MAIRLLCLTLIAYFSYITIRRVLLSFKLTQEYDKNIIDVDVIIKDPNKENN